MKKQSKNKVVELINIHKNMLAAMETSCTDTILSIVDIITKSLKKGGCVYLCGNGGSAADAQHIAGEFVGRFKKERRALRAVALSTDTSIITAIANDYGYEKIFSKQVEAHVKKGDILWTLSGSGNSVNLIEAAKSAKKQGAFVIAFTGRKNSKLEKLCDVCFCVPNDLIARSQEMHQLGYHIICELVEENFCR
jgi:D-sedoheptulose 7-phosphate isomerase